MTLKKIGGQTSDVPGLISTGWHIVFCPPLTSKLAISISRRSLNQKIVRFLPTCSNRTEKKGGRDKTHLSDKADL